MDIDDLKSDWRQAGNESLSEKELATMTRVRNHPSLRKLRTKFMTEIIALAALLLLYYDGFDGAEKPFLINILLVMSILLYIISNSLGYSQIQNPSVSGNIREALAEQRRSLKRLAVFSLTSSVVYATALMVFFTYQMVFTQRKYIILTALILSSFLLFYYSWISWQRKITHFRQLEADF
jgi:cation transport ATPase